MPRRFPIFQFPNRPLIVAGLAGAVARLADPRYSSLARLVSHLALLVWVLEEVLSGANWFRRLLGLGGVADALSRLLGLAGAGHALSWLRRPASSRHTRASAQ